MCGLIERTTNEPRKAVAARTLDAVVARDDKNAGVVRERPVAK
jgi:hypothetical protein